MAINVLETSARTILIVMNIISGLMALVIFGVGFAGINHSNELEDRSPLLGDLGISPLCKGLVFIGFTMSGLAGLSLACTMFKWKKFLTVCSLLTFLGALSEISLGAFILESKEDDYLNTIVGPERWGYQSEPARERFQNSFPCCGWQTMRVAGCVYRRVTCMGALSGYIEENVVPLADAAIGIGVLHLISLFFSCFVIFQSKQVQDDFFTNPFSY